MSRIFFSDKELDIFDTGYRAGATAALEEAIKIFPLLEERYYDVFDRIESFIKRVEKDENDETEI